MSDASSVGSSPRTAFDPNAVEPTCDAPPRRVLEGWEGRQGTEDAPIPYHEARPILRDGDLVLCRGRGLLSQAIIGISGERYSHVGMLLWWGDLEHGRLMVVEAHWPGGLRAVPLSWLVCEYPGKIDLFRVKNDYRRPDPSDRKSLSKAAKPEPRLSRHALVEPATYFLGRDFAIYDLLRVGVLHMTGKTLPSSKKGATDFFCSEYISRVLCEAGMDPSRQSDFMTTPSKIAKSKYFETLGRVGMSECDCKKQREGERV